MTQIIAGPGLGLPIPQNLYPSELYNAPYDFATNEVTLAPGDEIPIPAGQWLIGSVGTGVTSLEVLDPITGVWRMMPSGQVLNGGMQFVRSDGFNLRLANRTGCVVAAVVTTAGTGYTQAAATVTASAGSSTYQPIVGGQVSVISVGTVGASYTMAPLVLIPSPPSPGIAATAAATISAGTVASVSLTNTGAGYTSIPAAVILPNPGDPNVATITQAAVTLGTVGSGTLTGCLVTNPGAAQAGAVAPTLTVGGGTGTTATVAAVMLSTATSLSIIAAGGGYPATGNVEISSIGGRNTSSSTNTNPATNMSEFRPRKASVAPTITGGTIAATGTIYDGGLFTGAPANALLAQNGSGTTASVQFVLGSVNDTVIMQQL